MPDKVIAYVAFLRGINVGGNRVIKMTDLKKYFESYGFTNVQTVIASGNVRFDATESDPAVLAPQIEAKLKKSTDFQIDVILRSLEHLKKAVEAEPFKKIPLKDNVRLYVTFLAEKPPGGLKIPYESPLKDFKILSATPRELFSVGYIRPNLKLIDSMAIIEKEYGKKVTTRNWNTIQKIVKL